jgi:hypothetical protein
VSKLRNSFDGKPLRSIPKKYKPLRYPSGKVAPWTPGQGGKLTKLDNKNQLPLFAETKEKPRNDNAHSDD